MPNTQSTASQTSPGDAVRALAAKQTDPVEVASLLRSAATFDEADRKVRKALADLDESIRRSKMSVEAMRRRDHLPPWAVIVVMLLFVAFLVFVAAKHHI